jgi:hypothetical protein
MQHCDLPFRLSHAGCQSISKNASFVMERFLRSWRQDALNRGQHDSAIYIGDKVLALTSKSHRHDADKEY